VLRSSLFLLLEMLLPSLLVLSGLGWIDLLLRTFSPSHPAHVETCALPNDEHALYTSKLACRTRGAAWISPNVRACTSTAILKMRLIPCARFASTRTDQADSLCRVRGAQEINQPSRAPHLPSMFHPLP
jgi:hypothetical protein